MIFAGKKRRTDQPPHREFTKQCELLGEKGGGERERRRRRRDRERKGRGQRVTHLSLGSIESANFLKWRQRDPSSECSGIRLDLNADLDTFTT